LTDLDALKAQARRIGLEARAGVGAQARARLARRALADGARLARGRRAAIAIFAAMRDEPDLEPLARALRAAGHLTALPTMQGRGRPLLFRRWEPGDPLETAAFGVREPRTDAPLVTPSLVFLPFAAYDRAGFRVGYGGGFYDRTLAALRAQAGEEPVLAVGVGFGAQEIATAPRGPTDEALDMILTDAETLIFAPDLVERPS
jgi:5-formyltetrahydrofolate cyclo-ligase